MGNLNKYGTPLQFAGLVNTASRAAGRPLQFWPALCHLAVETDDFRVSVGYGNLGNIKWSETMSQAEKDSLGIIGWTPAVDDEKDANGNFVPSRFNSYVSWEKGLAHYFEITRWTDGWTVKQYAQKLKERGYFTHPNGVNLIVAKDKTLRKTIKGISDWDNVPPVSGASIDTHGQTQQPYVQPTGEVITTDDGEKKGFQFFSIWRVIVVLSTLASFYTFFKTWWKR